jgi:hypothetical protein
MDDSTHQHIVEHRGLKSNVVAPRTVRTPPRQIVPQSIVQRMVDRPVTTAAIFVLLGAFAAEGIALLFARAHARTALEKSAIRNLRLAQELDPHGDPLIR